MKKTSNLIGEPIRKNVLNYYWGAYTKHRKNYPNTSFERFLELNLFPSAKHTEGLNKKQIKRLFIKYNYEPIS